MDSNSVHSLIPTDADAIQQLLTGVKGPGIPLWSKEQIETEISSCLSVSFRRELEILAFITFRQLTHPIFEISFLACLKTEQRAGVATRLFEEFLSYAATLAAESGFDHFVVWLEVHEKNDPALAFYEKLGFENVGRRASYYADGGAALLYSLEKSKSDRGI